MYENIEDLLKIRVTNHFCKRYYERVEGKTEAEADSLSKEHDKVYSWLEKVVPTSKYLISEESFTEQSKNKCHYYVATCGKHYWVFIANPTNQAWMTMYPVDFGISDRINMLGTQEVLKMIDEYRDELEELIGETGLEIARKRSKIEVNESQIKELQAQIDILQRENNIELENIKHIEKNREMLDSKIRQNVFKLIYSIQYNLEKMRR